MIAQIEEKDRKRGEEREERERKRKEEELKRESLDQLEESDKGNCLFFEFDAFQKFTFVSVAIKLQLRLI
jgi:hypothetical protein